MTPALKGILYSQQKFLFAAEFSGRAMRRNRLAPLQGSRLSRTLDFLHVLTQSLSYMNLEDGHLSGQYSNKKICASFEKFLRLNGDSFSQIRSKNIG
jgi:hypothetical protein